MEKKIDRAVASAALAATLPAHTCVDRPHLPCDACTVERSPLDEVYDAILRLEGTPVEFGLAKLLTEVLNYMPKDRP